MTHTDIPGNQHGELFMPSTKNINEIKSQTLYLMVTAAASDFIAISYFYPALIEIDKPRYMELRQFFLSFQAYAHIVVCEYIDDDLIVLRDVHHAGANQYVKLARDEYGTWRPVVEQS